MKIDQIKFQVKYLRTCILNAWHGRNSYLEKGFAILSRDNYRLSTGMTISLILHIFLIGAYWGLSDITVDDSPPIREINFIDMTEEVEVPAPPKQPKTFRPAPRIAELQEESPDPDDQKAGQSVSMLATGRDRIFLDMPRKQAPINLGNTKPVASNLAKPKDVIKISPAKGIRENNMIARPAGISLDGEKKVLLASNQSPQSGINLAASAKPNIQLSGSSSGKTGQAPVGEGISMRTKPPRVDLEKKNGSFKQTQTFITGPLANRDIIQKVIPPFPNWAKKQGVGATISLRFTVMENGDIRENVIVERTSGSGDWDRLVIEALKKWQFASLEKSGMRMDQTGIITFQFVI